MKMNNLFPNPVSTQAETQSTSTTTEVKTDSLNPISNPIMTPPQPAPLPHPIFNPTPNSPVNVPLSMKNEKAIKQEFQKLEKSGDYTKHPIAAFPMGEEFTRLTLENFMHGIPDAGRTVSALIPSGSLTFPPKAQDPNGAKQFYIEVSQDSIAGLMTHRYGPFPIPHKTTQQQQGE